MTSRIGIPHIEHIVSRNLSRWQSSQRGLEERQQSQKLERHGPFITISRQYGAGGRELGRRLALELGWKLYDRNLLEEMAKGGEAEAAALGKLEDGSHNAMTDAILMSLGRDYPGHHVYLKQMVAMVTSLGEEGQVVFVGRGAHLVLPPRYGVRIRLIAPLEQRAALISQERAISIEEAQIWVESADRNQEDMIRRLLHQDLNDVSAYDLVINMADVEIDTAVAVVRTLVERKLGGMSS